MGGDFSPSEIIWKRRGRCRLLYCETLESGRWSGEVYSENDEYSFRLARSDRDRPWTLVQLVLENGTGVPRANWIRLDIGGVSCGLFPLAVKSASAIELFKSRGISVDSITRTPDDMVTLTFHVVEGREDVAGALHFFAKQGTLTLDPRFGFGVVCCEVPLPDGRHSIRRFAPSTPREREREDAARLGTFTTAIRDAKGQETEVGKMEVKSFRLGDRVPRKEFRLSAFGIPEPSVVAQSGHLRYWWGIAGVGFLIAVIGIWAFARSRSFRN